MPTNTELVNAALRKGGAAKRILDLTDPVGSAGIAGDILETERAELSRSGVWNFAVTRIQLSQLATLPVFGWALAYTLPSDCERVISVHDTSDGAGQVPYKIEALKQTDGSYLNVIVTDSTSIYLRYVRTVTDPNLMTTSFRQVLILRMAKIFAIAIAKSNALFQGLSKEEEAAFRRAKSVDGIEDYPESLPEGSWAASRRAYGWGTNRGWPQ